jgi:nitrogen fixation/metabolism regulation signal transduction histidine kinase
MNRYHQLWPVSDDRESGELSTSEAESSSRAVIALDDQGHIAALNRKAKSIMRAERDKLKGLSLGEAIANTNLHALIAFALVSDKPVTATIEEGTRKKRLRASATCVSDHPKTSDVALICILTELGRGR